MSGASADWSDGELLKRLRRDDAAACREYFSRFRLLLGREARRLGVQPALREEVVDDCLGDVALELIEPDATLPLSLNAHLLGALRHRVWNERRNRRRRERRETSAGEDAPGMGERVVPATCSQAAIDASASVEARSTHLAPAIERLVVVLERALTEDERVLAAWLGEWVPQTTIATWLGISFGAARVRVHRLRERLRTAALEYVEGLDATERRQLVRLLARRTSNGARVATPQTRSTPPPPPEPPTGGRAA
jgi:DNA-directed RNA polymerase specialized sigma24 family protein